MNRLGAVVSATACLLAVPEIMLAQRLIGAAGISPVSVVGTVYSEQDNRRIERASVRLCDVGGHMLEQDVTTDSGEFHFRDLKRGSYMLAVGAIGYLTENVPVDLTFSSDKSLSVYLKSSAENATASVRGVSVSAHEMSIPKAARDLVAAGKVKFYKDKNVMGGLTDLQQAASSAPGYYEAYYELGMAYFVMEKQDDAEQSFVKAIELSGDKYGDAEVGLGAVMMNKGNLTGGEEAIRHGVELNPNSWLGFYELAKIELSGNRIAEARKSAEQVRALAPNYPMVYRLLANIHMRQKDYAAMLADIDAYVKLDPDSPAGIRAKQMREEVKAKIAKERSAAPTQDKP